MGLPGAHPRMGDLVHPGGGGRPCRQRLRREEVRRQPHRCLAREHLPVLPATSRRSRHGGVPHRERDGCVRRGHPSARPTRPRRGEALGVDHAVALPVHPLERLGPPTAGLTLRVLVLSSLYPPQVLGGYERSCHDVMTRFTQRGHEVVVLTTDTRLPGIEPGTEPNVRAQLKWYWRDHEIVRPRLRERLSIERNNRRVLEQTLADVRPDVVSVWSMGALSLSLV